MFPSSRFLLVMSVSFALQSGVALGEKKYGPGVTDTEIKIGQTMPYSDPLSAFRIIGRAGAAYFAMINSKFAHLGGTENKPPGPGFVGL